MISDSDESYTSSTHSSTVVPDRVQKLFEKLEKEKSLDTRKNRNVSIKNTDTSKSSKINGKGYDFKDQNRANQLNSSKVIKSEYNFNDGEKISKNGHLLKLGNNRTKTNRLNPKNSLEQNGKITKSAEEMWKEKMNSLVKSKIDSSDTEESETSSDILYRKAFTSEVSDEQYTKRKGHSKIAMSNSKDTDFARKKAEEWLRAGTLTTKDGKSDSRGLDIADSSAAEDTEESDLETTFVQPKRNDPIKSTKGKLSKNAINGKISSNPNPGTSKSSTKPSDGKQALKSSLFAKKTSITGKTELPRKTNLAKKSETSKVIGSSKKSDSEKKTDISKKTEPVKKSLTMYNTNVKYPEASTKMSKVGSEGISKGSTSAVRSSISNTHQSSVAQPKVGQRSGQVTSKKTTTNTTAAKKPNLVPNETTKISSKPYPPTTGIKKIIKKN